MLKFHRLPIRIKMLVLAAILALPALGMTIYAGIEGLDESIIDDLALLAVSLMISFTLVWIICKRTMLERINALVSASQRLAAGDLQARVPGISELEPGDELWNLGQTFNVMAWQLEAREQQQRHSQEHLRESEERFRSAFFEAGIGMAMGSPEGCLRRANETFCAFIGYPETELQGLTFKDITVDEDFPKELELAERLIWGEIAKYNIEKRYRHRQGHIIWGQVNVSLVRDAANNPAYFICQIQDITEQKKAEEVLLDYQERLAELAAELSLAEERERHRIATELHDQIGQNLALSSMRLSALGMFSLPDDVCREVSSIKERLDISIEGIRSLISQLSPPILYEMGLEAALKWLGRTMKHDWCLTVTIREEGPPLTLGHEIRTTIFRIVRELLTNVVKHACTDQVWIELLREDEGVTVWVEDHGAGFEHEQADTSRPNRGGFGLFSIRQKIRYLKGDFSVQSEPGRMTRIMFKIPLPGIAPAANIAELRGT